MQRVLGNGSLQLVLEVEGRNGDIDEQGIQQAVNQAVTKEVSVTTRQARFDADKEIVLFTRGTTILEDQVQDMEQAARNQLITTNSPFSITEWRIEIA